MKHTVENSSNLFKEYGEKSTKNYLLSIQPYMDIIIF